MAGPLRVLFIEDDEADKKLVLHELSANNVRLTFTQVETEKQLRSALKKEDWQLVICNYLLSDFDAFTALKIVREQDADVPFIIISDALGEQTAVKAMRAGANDYILKSNMQRLLPAIERELKEAENRIQQKKAEEEKNLLLEVVQQSENEIYIMDLETIKFEYLNSAALTNLGYSEAEIHTLTPQDINPEVDKDYMMNCIKSLTDGEFNSIFFTTYHKRKDETVYPIELRIQTIHEHERRFAVSIGIDLTERKKDAQIIRMQKKLTDKLSQSNEFKSQFLANMSHELRTPLNSINLLSRLLMNNRPGNLNKEQLEYLDVIYKSGNNLLDLINKVLDFSKVEAGEITVQLEQTLVEKICGSLEMMFSPIAREKGLCLSVNKTNNFTTPILTDPLRLEQILKNLLSNACKFTEEGTVELSVCTPESGEISNSDTPDDWIAFRIRDTGIGIPKNKHELIFEAFQQTDHSTQRIYGGTGLGLSICRELAGLLGGTLTLQSEVGKGSTFSLYLPVDATKTLGKSSYQIKEQKNTNSDIFSFIAKIPLLAQNNGEKTKKNLKKLLLVDDSEIHVSALKELLETNERKCLIAGSAKDTIEILDSTDIDCVVLDLGLPDVNGFELIKKIKDDYKLKYIPIIVYTGKNLSIEEEKELKKLVTAVIIKTSNNFKKLNKTIDRLLEIRDIQSDRQEVPESNIFKNKKILIVDDDYWNAYSLSIVLEQLGTELISASNGKEALEILYDTPDIDLVIMDIRMPVLDGYETIKKIRENKSWGELAVIAVTSISMGGEREKCIEAGFSDYLNKPVKVNDLIESLHQSLT